MNRMFYSRPDPKEFGFRWKEFEKASAEVERVEQRLEEVEYRRAQVEQELRDLGATEEAALTEAIRAGKDDPEPRDGERERLEAEKDRLQQKERALAQVLGEKEEALRITAFENQGRWKEEVDAALEKALEEEGRAYAKAREIIEAPRHKRLRLQALSRWVRRVEPTFGINGDIAGHTAIGNLEADAWAAGEQLRELRQAEANEQAWVEQQREMREVEA